MQASSINLFLAGLSLLCSIQPLHSDPQPPYWMNYKPYNPINHQLNPPPRIQVYEPSFPQRSPSLQLNPYQSPPSLIYPEGTADLTRYQDSYQDYDYQDYSLINEKQETSKELIVEENTSIDSKEKEITKKLEMLDRLLSEDSSDKDLYTNEIDDKIIPEESKRVVREVRKHRPGFFWTLARVTFETINDTRSAIKQISDIINNTVAPDSATQGSMSSALTAINSANATTNATGSVTVNATETTTTSPMNTTGTTFVITRSRLQSLIRRNVLGLVRLFNIEWNDALNQSESNVREFQKDLGNQVGMYLRDNPNAF